MSKFLSAKAKKWTRRNSTKRFTTAYNDAKSIGILFCIGDRKKHDTIKRFIKRLENDGKKVEVLTFLPPKKENHEFLFDYFTTKDISFWGNYKTDQVFNFTKKSFDYLFHVDFEATEIINGVLALSQAKCRVGKYNVNNDKFYELMINVNGNDVDHLVDEMYKYTTLLT